MWKPRFSRTDLSDGLANDDDVLMCDIDHREDTTRCQEAQAMWADVYGDARTGDRQPRIDPGRDKKLEKADSHDGMAAET